MKLLKLTLHNFMPYRGTHSIEFPIVDGRGIVVVYGDNMRGKTSVLNSIRWVLYGKATARHLREVENIALINADAADAGEWLSWVELAFYANGADYTLRRTLEKASFVARPTVSGELVERVTLRKDGSPLDSEAIQQELNQVLPEQVSRFFLFDGELLQEYETLVRDLNQGPRIKLAIERVLGVPAIVNGRDELRTLLGQAQSSQAQDLRHLKSLRSQAEQQLRLQSEMTEHQQHLTSQNQRRSSLLEELEGIDTALERLAAQRDVLVHLDEIRHQRDVLRERFVGQRERRANLLQEAWRDLLEPQLRDRVTSLEEKQKGLIAQVQEKARLQVHAQLLGDAFHTKHCPICKQMIGADRVKPIAVEFGTLEAKLKTIAEDFDEIGVTTSKLSIVQRLRGLGLATQVAETERMMQNTSLDIQKLEIELSQLSEDLERGAENEVLRLSAQRGPLQAALGAVESEINVLEELIKENAKKQAQIARLLARNPEARRQRSSALVEKYGALERVFSGSVEKLRDTQRERVAAFASSAFKQLISESAFTQLSINENYGLTILDEKGRPVDERSAGAEQIVALSLIDGLNKAARRLDPIVMDTPFGRLDSRHRQNVLRYLPAMAEQVILLVHEGEMDPERDLPLIKQNVSAIYKIERVSSRQSRLVLQSP